ncbi:MAG: 30S ribosomal protein S12 methylthiotransferase RimO [Phycisphaerae bacterium]|jgi:ribosomal protein S12 methylthiotransferase|nr:30S ribosomal protein S12 methylthiotransferase RimO [Phycisphaerae bacterium]
MSRRPVKGSDKPSPGVERVSFVSLGCPKNLVDSEKMLGVLHQSGLTLVNEDEGSDAIVINTCGFLEASKDESLDVIRDAIERKGRGELKRVVVAGCLVQRHRAKLLEWAPGIDAMIGVFDRDHILDAVRGSAREALGEEGERPRYWIAGNALQAAKERGRDVVGLTVNGLDGKGVGYFEDDSNRYRLTPRHWAYLRVSEGCNQRCAFCTIPSIRGKMRSKPVETIVSEARALMADGAFELNLIGQDTTSFGMDIGYGPGLVGMLESLDQVAREQGGGWMRLMYAYPTKFDDAMIDAMARLEHIVKYIDIPLQHMSTRMLDMMRRNISKEDQLALLEKLRERIPGIAIRTTFITGFPGETQEDHEELLEVVSEFGFDMMGVFRYSPEEGTPAGTMDRDPALHVPDEVKAEREAELMLAQQEVAFEQAKYVAEQKCQFDVLIDAKAAGKTKGRATTGVSKGGQLYTGRTYFQAPQIDSLTYIHAAEELAPGELVRCTIVDSDGYDLIAQPTHEMEKKIRLPIMK